MEVSRVTSLLHIFLALYGAVSGQNVSRVAHDFAEADPHIQASPEGARSAVYGTKAGRTIYHARVTNYDSTGRVGCIPERPADQQRGRKEGIKTLQLFVYNPSSRFKIIVL